MLFEMKNKIFSGIDRLPSGTATNQILDGCLVLEGGAFRGIYTCGVLDALMEHHINLQCTIGVSAGAMTGVNYVAGHIGRAARINLRYRHDPRYVGLPAIRHNHGIIGFDFVFEDVQEAYPFDEKRFFAPERRFLAVATDCLTGQPAYFEKGKTSDIFQAVRASASMPYVSKMVPIDGRPYLDGGCSTKIPYEWALQQNFEKIVVVKTRPDSFRREVHQKHTLPKRFYAAYPQLVESLEKSNECYNAQCDQIEQLRKKGRLFVISPSQPVSVRRLEKDMEKLGALYYLGYQDGNQSIQALKEYLCRA